jgi:alpha-tubulin suppressor-like RCC1 family protein
MSIARTIPTHATARLFTTGNNVYETRQVNFKHEPDARVIQVASGYDHALILTGNQRGHTNILESGRVHFVGNCDYIYTSEETVDWASPILLPKTVDLKVLSLSCGYNHAVFLVENKDIVSVYGLG